MKLNKRILSVFVIALLAILLIGCNGTSSSTGGTETTTSGSGTTSETTTTTETQVSIDWATLESTLRTQYAASLDDDDFVATADLNLITQVGDATISWSSNKPELIENDGTIHRPAFSTGDQTVILTATITIDSQEHTVMFFVTVGKLAKTDAERAEEVFVKVMAFPNKEKWSSADSDSLTFAEKGTDLDNVEYDVVWSSNHPEYISATADIIQPLDEDVTVTITATVTINGVDYSKTKEFVVAKLEEGKPVASIAEAIAEGQDAYVMIPGVTVIAMYASGDVFFTDGTDILYIYTPPFTAEVGQVYDVSGMIDFYYNAPQLAGSDTHPLRAVPSTEAAKAHPVTTVTSVMDIITATTTPTEEDPFSYTAYSVEAAVYYDEAWGNYSLFLVPVDYDFDAAIPDGKKQPNGDSIMIYYRSNDEVLQAFHGQVVTVEIVMQGWRTDLSVWYANFFGTPLDVDIDIADDATAVSTALTALQYPEIITDDITLRLPETLYGVSLEYSVDDANAINVDTGAVNASGQTTQVTVNLTINATRGTVSDSKVVTIKVGELPLSTVATMLEATEGMFKLEGIVISGEYQNTYFFQDATDNIALYTDGNATIEKLLEDNIGNVVIITGTRDAYNGLDQIRVQTVEFKEESTVPTPTNLDSLELTSANLEDHESELVELTKMIVIEVSSDSYGNIYMTLKHLTNGTTIDVKWDSRVTLPTELNTAIQSVSEGDAINITTVLAWNKTPILYVVTTAEIEEVTLSDADKLNADKAGLNFGGNVYEATTVTLPLTGTNGSTITWAITADAGSNASYEATTGVLTINQPTADATVEVTATLGLGDETATAVFTYTLMNITKVDLGDFASQTIGEVVAVKGIVYAVIQNGFFIEDATGQLFVFTYDASYNVGDEVELLGEVAEYKSSYQLSNLIGLPAALSTDNDVTMEAEMYEHGTTTLEAGQLYTVIGTVAIEGDYDNVYIYVNLTDKFEIYYKSPDASIAALEALDGKMVVVDIIYYNNSTVFAYTGGTDGVSLYAEVTDFTELTAMTDGTNLDLPDGSYVTITGVVTGNSFDGLFIQDANGVGFFLYKPYETGINLGDKVVYFGELSSYKDARQVAFGAELVEVVSTGNDLIVTSVTADDIDAFGLADAATLYSYAGFTLNEIDGTTMTLGYTLADGVTTGTVTVRYYTNWDDLKAVAANFTVGDVLPELEFVVYNYRDGLVQLDVVSANFTEAQSVEFDAALLPATLTMTEDYVIPTPEFGSTFTVTAVSTELDAYIDEVTTLGTLEYTEPSADVSGTITIQVAKGTTTQDVVINVTVKSSITVLYTTGFETSEGFTSSTSYTGGLSDVNGWTVVEGTVTTTDASAEDMHLQMRDYDSVSGFPYAEYHSTVAFNNVQLSTYSNQATGFQLVVQFSLDGTTWSTGSTIDLTGNDTVQDITSDVTDAMYVRFTVNHSVTPNKQRVNIDDIKLY